MRICVVHGFHTLAALNDKLRVVLQSVGQILYTVFPQIHPRA